MNLIKWRRDSYVNRLSSIHFDVCLYLDGNSMVNVPFHWLAVACKQQCICFCNPSTFSNVNNWKETWNENKCEALFTCFCDHFHQYLGIHTPHTIRPTIFRSHNSFDAERHTAVSSRNRTINNFRIQIDRKLFTWQLQRMWMHPITRNFLYKSINYLVWIRIHLEISQRIIVERISQHTNYWTIPLLLFIVFRVDGGATQGARTIATAFVWDVIWDWEGTKTNN